MSLNEDIDFTPKPRLALEPRPAMDLSPETKADITRWNKRQAELADKRSAALPKMDTDEMLRIARENLPETAPPLPLEYTPEGQRLARFKQMCPVEFQQVVNRSRLANVAAYDRVTSWDGSFRGPVLSGKTGTRKTGAAWDCLSRLYVHCGMDFAWWPVKKLVTDLEEYEAANMAEAFWRKYSRMGVLMVDDLDKINWSFESQKSALFAFYDWIYRDHRPCITTTNKDRAWWTERMGEAFARRLFEDAHFTIQF